MKIGILTFHKSINYGSVLQAWALSTILKSMGYDVEVIDYEPTAYKKMYPLFRKFITFSDLKYNIKRIPIAKTITRQNHNFQSFQKKYLSVSKDHYTETSDFTAMSQKYDCIICGSDQVWNIHAKDCDKVFFLPFEFTGKRIAYAVSVNNTTFREKECDEKLKSAIRKFCFLSVREEKGAERLNQFVGEDRKIFTLLDPTLLHEKTDYDAICSNRIVRGEYIFLYNVWSSNAGIEAAKKLSKITGLPVYTTVMKRDQTAIKKNRNNGIIVDDQHMSPSDFLSFIKYAAYVVTESFHGTAFSLIFEKNFVCVNEVRTDGSKKNDERIINILAQLGLQNRYLTLDQITWSVVEKKPDYGMVTRKRLQIAGYSLNLLKNAIDGEEESTLDEN